MGAVELCAQLLERHTSTPTPDSGSAKCVEHVVATICNLACVDGAAARFDRHPVTADLLAVCRQRPALSLLEPTLSALWVLLPQQRPMEVFLAHSGLAAVVDAVTTDGCRSLNSQLALIGIIRVMTLSPTGLAEVSDSTAVGRVCDTLKQYAK